MLKTSGDRPGKRGVQSNGQLVKRSGPVDTNSSILDTDYSRPLNAWWSHLSCCLPMHAVSTTTTLFCLTMLQHVLLLSDRELLQSRGGCGGGVVACRWVARIPALAADGLLTCELYSVCSQLMLSQFLGATCTKQRLPLPGTARMHGNLE